MWDKTYYPVGLFDLKTDATAQLVKYTIRPFEDKSYDYLEMCKEFAKHGKKLKLKMIQKRRF